jgi:RHS repeat-associated protein
VALAVNRVVSYLGNDHLGNATVALSSTGNVQASQLYAPYGTVRYVSGTMPCSYGFTGQHSDGATGLDDYNARYYDPLAGQFISADTWLAGLDRYAYVWDSPVVHVDPSGHGIDCGENPKLCWDLFIFLANSLVQLMTGSAGPGGKGMDFRSAMALLTSWSE